MAAERDEPDADGLELEGYFVDIDPAADTPLPPVEERLEDPGYSDEAVDEN